MSPLAAPYQAGDLIRIERVLASTVDLVAGKGNRSRPCPRRLRRYGLRPNGVRGGAEPLASCPRDAFADLRTEVVESDSPSA